MLPSPPFTGVELLSPPPFGRWCWPPRSRWVVLLGLLLFFGGAAFLLLLWVVLHYRIPALPDPAPPCPVQLCPVLICSTVVCPAQPHLACLSICSASCGSCVLRRLVTRVPRPVVRAACLHSQCVCMLCVRGVPKGKGLNRFSNETIRVVMHTSRFLQRDTCTCILWRAGVSARTASLLTLWVLHDGAASPLGLGQDCE